MCTDRLKEFLTNDTVKLTMLRVRKVMFSAKIILHSHIHSNIENLSKNLNFLRVIKKNLKVIKKKKKKKEQVQCTPH